MTNDLALPDKATLAIVDGRPYTELPDDLFIPPDALEVLLDSFSGPLDLLLYLIKRQNLDILNIPMTLITKQYMQYIQIMKVKRLELAADYLVMAAVLAEIKSKMLLPRDPVAEDEIEDDPRMTLVKRLQAYEQFKLIASFIDDLPRYERDVFQVQLKTDQLVVIKPHPEVELHSLLEAIQSLVKQNAHLVNHQISREPLSVQERMAVILQRLQDLPVAQFSALLLADEGRMGLVVTLLAILELARQSLVTITQVGLFTPIYLKVS